VPRGITAIGVFLIFGATMAALAGVTLAHPGTPLDRIWSLNRPAYIQLAPLGRSVGIGFLLLGASLAIAAVGWFRRAWWGWLMAVAIITTQLLGDGFNLLRGDFLRGAVGVLIASALLYYIVRLRPFFRSGS
jgi:hypothetical protein